MPPIPLAVGVLTFRRPALVAELVPVLVAQVEALAGVADGVVLVVDNDPDASSREAVAAVAAQHPGRVRWVHEPRPGIAAARNRAIDESADARLLAFIDDDERPEPRWLAELVGTWVAHDPAAVAGRVLEEFQSDPDPWVVAGGFFRRRSLPSGTQVEASGAGNLMLDLDRLRAAGLRFDPRFSLSGGEDTMLCRQMRQAGMTIVWCDEAQVTDLVPDARATRRWVLHRAYSHGNTAAFIDVITAPSAGRRALTRVRRVVGGAARVPVGAGRWLGGVVLRSQRHQARGLRAVYRGAGMVTGAIGSVHDEYAREGAVGEA